MSGKVSALFYKLCAAFGAAHHDPSLAARDPDLLTALGALINVILYVLGRTASTSAEKGEKLVPQSHIFLIFRISGRYIAGESPEIDHKQKDSIYNPGYLNERKAPGEGGKMPRYPACGDQDQNHHG